MVGKIEVHEFNTSSEELEKAINSAVKNNKFVNKINVEVYLESLEDKEMSPIGDDLINDLENTI